jgi:pilus assembly protein CpaE
VIVDTSSLLNELTLAVLDATNLLVLLITQDIPSIKNARLFLDLADGLGITRDKILLVMNRYDKRRSITPERVKDNFKKDVDIVIPVEERLVVPAMDRGEPFVLKNANNPTGKAILDLATKISSSVKTMANKQAEAA